VITTLGVVGGGTMGAGIAQLGLTAGFDVVLYDTSPQALEQAKERIATGIRKGRERGRWTTDATVTDSRLTLTTSLDGFASSELVIEAAPEQLELKHQLMRDLTAVCRPGTVLASNTSSIPLTLIAAGAPNPELVVGMHFFNPAPLMELVEVIPAEQSSEQTVQLATETGEALGKRVIRAPDGPGFLVNRCGRGYFGEPLRILAERIAEPAQIDRICRVGGDFRMGPFELMDLVGLDVSFAVAKSFAELSFGEPRWRPMPAQARMVASGKLGRKTGRGWYDYSNGTYRPQDPDLPEPGDASGRELAIVGEGPLALHLRSLADAAGFSVRETLGGGAEASIFADPLEDPGALADADFPIVSCAARSLSSRHLADAVGFNVASLAGNGRLVELTRTDATQQAHADRATSLFATLGMQAEWVRDGPGLVMGRVLVQVINEAAFAYGEGLASAADIDTGVVLGLNYPRGPLAWGAQIGWAAVLATLEGLWQERREERSRPAPALSAAAAGASPLAGMTLQAAGVS
jgi:3-hydroxybutyryl-CoA dehydrogenase